MIDKRRQRVWHTERCIKDIILLRSNEDNPRFTDPARIIATVNSQLNFSRNKSKTVEPSVSYDIICKGLLTMFMIIKFI